VSGKFFARQNRRFRDGLLGRGVSVVNSVLLFAIRMGYDCFAGWFIIIRPPWGIMTRTAFTTAFLGVVCFSVSVSAQPILIDQVVNNYSHIQPGLPNYGIAQGSIFIIGGTNLAASTASQGVPLQTNFARVTINVTVGGATTQAIPYFVSPGQITAILPSKTPVGSGTITVSWGGQSSSAPVHVVESAFGLLTVTVTGGSGIVVAQDYSEGGELLSQTNAANPGEYLILWGSGLGPVSGDETQYQTQTNLTNIPTKVYIGGVSATVFYHGRSAYPGLDQIDVAVPPGVSGCNVSLVVMAGGVPSNFAVIPVAASGRICSDPGLTSLTLEQNQELLSLSNVNVGTLSLMRLTTTSPVTSNVTTRDSAYATFQKYTAQQFASTGFLQQASVGSCVIIDAAGQPPLTGWRVTGPLNAGPEINVNGPGSLLTLFPSAGTYLEPGGSSAAIIPPTGGTFTFDNGLGGPDVGAFTASLSESLIAPLVWTNSSSITAIERANGQLFTWTGGIPGSYVYIFGYSFINEPAELPNGQYALYVYFTCSAPLSAGQFTVPAAVLESLPPSTAAYLYVANAVVEKFSAPSLDLGLFLFGVATGVSVPFN
jgi:uncharacterized protein (TIGR03437 family)